MEGLGFKIQGFGFRVSGIRRAHLDRRRKHHRSRALQAGPRCHPHESCKPILHLSHRAPTYSCCRDQKRCIFSLQCLVFSVSSFAFPVLCLVLILQGLGLVISIWMLTAWCLVFSVDSLVWVYVLHWILEFRQIVQLHRFVEGGRKQIKLQVCSFSPGSGFRV